MIEDAQITTILSQAIAAAVPGEEGNIIPWLQGEDWRVTTLSGTSSRLADLNVAALEAAARDQNSGLVDCILRQYRKTAPTMVRTTPERPAGKPQAASAKAQSRPQAKPDEPRREYDDETLARMILELLETNRLEEFTYNQVSDDPSIWCDWKVASRVLQRLTERGNDVIQYEVKKPGGGKAKLYKFAPERRALDRDYAQAHKIVGGAIIQHLETFGSASQIAVCGAMKAFFGILDKAVVKQVLGKLHADGEVTKTAGPRGARVFSLPLADQDLG